jgi:hypothetical protein
MRAAGGRAAPVRCMQRAERQPGGRVSIFSKPVRQEIHEMIRNVGPFSKIIYLTQYNCRLAKVKHKERIFLRQ